MVRAHVFQDVAGLGEEHDVVQLLRGARASMVVDDGCCCCRVEVEEEAGAADGRDGDGGLVEGGRRRLWAMRRRLIEHVQSFERMTDEIARLCDW